MDEPNDYGKRNCLLLDSWRKRSREYMYIDSFPYRADSIFIRNELRVKFLNSLKTPDLPNWAVVIVRIAKDDEERFLKCMEDLEKAMLIEGSSEYPEMCRRVMSLLDNDS